MANALENVGKWFESAFTGEEKEDRQAKEMVDRIMREYEGIEAPELSMPEYRGVEYSPVGSAFEGLSSDPILRQRQIDSLGALDEIVASGGMTAADVANLSRIQSQAGEADRGRREAIKQNMAMRGMGGSGAELLAQLQSSQGATNQASQQGLDVAGMAQQRALDAMLGGGELAGSIRGQDWGEEAQRAGNLDAISQFNAANQLRSGMYNADVYNRGQDAGNQLAQQGFQNQMSVAAGKSGALGQGVNYYTGVADRKQKAKGQILGGAVKAGTAAYTG